MSTEVHDTQSSMPTNLDEQTFSGATHEEMQHYFRVVSTIIDALKSDNETLGTENQELRSTVAELEEERERSTVSPSHSSALAQSICRNKSTLLYLNVDDNFIPLVREGTTYKILSIGSNKHTAIAAIIGDEEQTHILTLTDEEAIYCQKYAYQQLLEGTTEDEPQNTEIQSAYQALQQEKQELLQKIARAEELLNLDIDTLITTQPKMIPFPAYARLKQELDYMHKLYKNPALKPAQKIGLHMLRNAVEHGQTHDDEGRTRINATTIAAQMGMSPDTGFRLIQFCEEQLPELIDLAKHREQIPGAEGTTERTYIKFADQELLQHPDRIVPLTLTKQGGDRYSCQKCGSLDIKIKKKVTRTIVCLNPDCKHEVLLDEIESEQVFYGPEENKDKKQVASTASARNTKEVENISKNEQNARNAQKQLAFHKLYEAGYRNEGTLELIDQAIAEDVTLVVLDIRYTPQSRNPQWTQKALQQRYGKHYLSLRSLGNISHKEKGKIQIADAKRGIEQLAKLLHIHTVIILCGCPDYDCCHRKTVVELFQQTYAEAIADMENFCLPISNLRCIIKPFTPPQVAGGSIPDASDHIVQAATLLLSLAGDANEHIEMSRSGEKKYYTVHRPLSLDDVLDHLRGGQARGALCSRADGFTRSLAWDSDDDAGWALLSDAAYRLVDAGYLPILEKSAADRGGHLWVIYSELVPAESARRHALEIAPELSKIQEYWPGPTSAKKWNRVRLLGGRYVRYGEHVERNVDAWCELMSVADNELSRNGGVAAASLLLKHQTPASLVPVSSSEQCQEVKVVESVRRQSVPTSLVQKRSSGERLLPVVDSVWIANCGPVESTTYWFAVCEDYSATWFNAHHTLDEIRPREVNNMALSPNGSERTASTDYWESPDGERYTDYSQHGRLANGGRDTGDALQLATKVWCRSKGSILSDTTKEIIKQARSEMEAAALAGQPLPAWLEVIITPAGRLRSAAWAGQPLPTWLEATITPIQRRQYEKWSRESNHGERGTVHQLEGAGPRVSKGTGDMLRGSESDGSEDKAVGTTNSQSVRFDHRDGERTSRHLTGNGSSQLGEKEVVTMVQPGVLDVVSVQEEVPPMLLFEVQQKAKAETVPTSAAILTELDQLDVIKNYGRAHEWSSFELGGQEVIAPGREHWLEFVWLAGAKNVKQQVYAAIQRYEQEQSDGN